MNTQLIQLLDCEGEALGLYAYSGERYSHEQAASILDREYLRAKEQLKEANGDHYCGPGDVQEYVDEYLSALGIERVYPDEHSSAHF